MKYEAITIKDIAKALGLSSSTISKALRDSHEISNETKQVVGNYARKINYRPNPMAVGLKAKKTMSIGLIVPDLSNSFFSQVIDGIDLLSASKGYNLIITQSCEELRREENDLKFLTSRGIDGILISVTAENADHEYLRYLHSKGLPVVLFDRVATGIDTHKVHIDNYHAGFTATKHLLINGYRNIAAIASAESLTSTNDRVRGYKDALESFQIKGSTKVINYCERRGKDVTEVEAALKDLFNLDAKPDAIITMGERITLEAVKFIKRNKIKIPSEMAIVGFSNMDISTFTEPSLTIIRQPALAVGRSSVKLLLELIESKKPIEKFLTNVLKPELIVGASSMPKI